MSTGVGDATAAVEGPVVIIGGGVIGCSLAFHLTAAGFTDVTVLEAGLIGEGATAKATGGIRQQFSSRLNADICHEAVQYFEGFEDRVGEPFDFRQHGYLFLCGDEQQRTRFESDVVMQRELGIDVRLVENDDLRDLVPGLETDGLFGGTWTPNDGSGSPTDVTAGFARRAKSQGATIKQHTLVESVECAPDGSVVAVRTRAGERIEARVVVNAAGPDAATVGSLVGLDLPVRPHPRQAFAIEPLPQLRGDMPLTVDLSSGAYIHPEASGAGVVGGNDRNVPSSDKATVRWDLSEGVIEALLGRISWMENARISTGWCGLREMTPDDHAIVGPCEVPGWWNLVGFSGHGFMQAPVVGDHVARWMLGQTDRRSFDDFALARFATGGLSAETTVF